ncbi:agmatine deiminase family protein [Desulforhabdus amnigena]|uniref:Agmatine deiminase n=1 Tax=Desulforhabdus amnigena TaxID=40218 RepID=A0A9W6D3L8_9BACT|nr:agmatine deiminase family protein [Desulforhabdus amnigena]GLI34284.1 agmatine deiminase [Desulforhabdus amnigena]
MKRRLPAEWESQDGVLMAWPHEASDWRFYLRAVQTTFTEIIRHITRFEKCILVAPDPADVRARLQKADIHMERLHIYKMDTNDTWARDFGPITILEEGKPVLLDFGFNGWGLKFPADLDNQITRRLHQLGGFHSTPLKTVGLVLEGGSIESDGNGTILTTTECLTSPNRNPQLTRQEIQEELGRLLGADHFLWLENGFLAGDDTDSHVDTLARLCPDDTILHTACDDPSDMHFKALQAMTEELKRFRTRQGRPYRLIPLPWPSPHLDDEGKRLPATYANFLVLNGAVLVPTYRDPKDGEALNAVRKAFPDREIVGIDCSPLILQHGSLHCVTMQLPKGTLS